MDYRWTWPISETLHFCGLVLMTGTVGAFDLRLLGLGKGIAPAALHRSLRYGVIGFGISVVTGSLFIFGQPDQYFYNDAFKVKVVCLALLGLNVLAFYSLEARKVLALGPNGDAPVPATLLRGDLVVPARRDHVRGADADVLPAVDAARWWARSFP